MVERTLGQLRTVDAMPDATPELTIGQVAEQTGLSVHTLRFYEREGLLPMQIRRSSTGRRVYSAPDIEWLRICTSLRASGMPLDTIRVMSAWSGKESVMKPSVSACFAHIASTWPSRSTSLGLA